uniref:Uncharacterized protein n=1 Tax=Arundo donax TaxID=35708 RepID=A0A0A9BVP2_ARUDO
MDWDLKMPVSWDLAEGSTMLCRPSLPPPRPQWPRRRALVVVVVLRLRRRAGCRAGQSARSTSRSAGWASSAWRMG